MLRLEATHTVQTYAAVFVRYGLFGLGRGFLFRDVEGGVVELLLCMDRESCLDCLLDLLDCVMTKRR